MLVAVIILMCLGLASLTLFLIEKCRKYSVKELILKTTTSLFFLATGAVGMFACSPYHILGLFVVLGLACGMLGDIWLDLKYVFREKDKWFTYAGFISFAIGHILYITGFYLEFFQYAHWLYFVLPLVLGLLIGALPIALQKLLKIRLGDMTIITYIYSAILFSMTLCGLSLCIFTGFKNVTCILLFAGGLLFTISDLILSGTYFGEGHEKPFDIISNGVTYYIAQYLIAFSLMFFVL